jgi:hypothetical protein
MSKIAQLDPCYDLWLSYSWSNNNHGICGHTFEVIDYYHILKNHFRVGILIAEELDWTTFEKSIRSKYNFSNEEIDDIKSNTVFSLRPSLLKGRNILFTDGGVVNMSTKTLLFDNIFYFACGNREIKDNNKSNVWILQDNRVYEPVKRNGIDYKKRILFDRLKAIDSCKDQLLIYATKNCRNITDYQQFKIYNLPVLVITNEENKPNNILGFEFVTPPVNDIFTEFSTYLYTPVPRQWDCSPRFIAECHYYGKQVIYHNIDYWHIDHGLRIRKWDIDNDFDSLYLRDNDPVVNILKDIIC